MRNRDSGDTLSSIQMSGRLNFLPAPYISRCSGIYAIVNKSNNKVYIGSAIKLHKRWNSHRHDFEVGRQNPYLMSAFRKQPDDFYFEIIEELPESTKAVRLEREQFWMNFYQSYIPKHGYNLCPKAESCEGAKHGPEYSAKISARMKEYYKNKVWTEEERRKQSVATMGHKGAVWSDEQRKKRSEQYKGRKHSEESKRKMTLVRTGMKLPKKGRPVLQVNMEGNVIARFGAVAYAAEELNLNECNIRQCCNNMQKKHGGFYWRFSDQFSAGTQLVKVFKNLTNVPVVQFNKNGEEVGRYESQKDASKATGIHRCAIGNACNGIIKTSGGFKWRRA